MMAGLFHVEHGMAYLLENERIRAGVVKFFGMVKQCGTDLI